MTDVPNRGSGADSDPEARADSAAPGSAPYPPPYTPRAHSDDELAAALAAQTAMYTGPITIPVINSDPAFRPDPTEVDSAVPPPEDAAPVDVPPATPVVNLLPVPVPPAPVPMDFVAPDMVAAEPEPVSEPVSETPPPAFPTFAAPSDAALPVFQSPFAAVPPFATTPPEPAPEPAPAAEEPSTASVPSTPDPVAPPLTDAEIFGMPPVESALPGVDPYGPPPQVEQVDGGLAPPPESAPDEPALSTSSSTLDAILMLEDELRRRQELPPTLATAETPLPSIDTPPAAAVDTSDTPASAPPAPEFEATPAPSLDERLRAASPPVAGEASFAPPPVAAPGWTPAPDPEREGIVSAEPTPTGEAPAASAPTTAQPWLTAPPPAFGPPPLVEPPAPEGGEFDAAVLTPPPNLAPAPRSDSGIDVTTLPPPGATPPSPVSIPAGFAPSDYFAASSGQAPGAGGIGDPDVEGIDDTDRADLAQLIPVGADGVAEVSAVPTGVAAVTGTSAGAAAVEPTDPHPFAVERVAVMPTPIEQRAGRAARMFWLWFAANSSFISIAAGATMLAMGLSLRQALVATLLGIVLSTIPLGLGARAGKWSGQPTMVVSRATFGHIGNVIPAILAIIGRIFWGGVILWVLTLAITPVILGRADTGLTVWAVVVLACGVVLAALVAVVGYGLLYRLQRVLTILSALLMVATIVVTADRFDSAVILRTSEGSWVLALGGAVLVFSVVGLAWAQSSSDLARYQRPGSSTGATSVWTIIGVVLPTLTIISWGAILAASDRALAEQLAADPIAALLDIVPGWFAIPLLASAALGLISAAILTMYSGGLAIISAGVRMPRPIATLLASTLIGAAAFVLLAMQVGAIDIIRDLATTLAVPIAAWAGIFGGEMMIRSRRFHTPSLLARGGAYASVRWVNLLGLLALTGLGYGLTTAELPGLEWQGYLLSVLGVSAQSPWAATDVGVIVALVLGVLLPLITGIPGVRRQEKHEESTATAGMPAVDALVD
ncbi:cytosine permease [Salinibacterium sp. ZJ70]|uniref:purine-cytosine permease family protein n=1 Tax=Salinibacterium sp. ZJ70 TaxID=2708084 RepID=UPI001420D311|nr:cytosine permease [Salinibacterium sp. ZJ70]